MIVRILLWQKLSGMVDWKTIFKDTSWFHWTGITPAISQGAADACLEAVKTGKRNGNNDFNRFKLQS